MRMYSILCFLFFFFQAEDGIRDRDVTGVQTCAPSDLAGGHVVNVGDAWARGAPAGWSAYAASKAGLEALTRVLAAELRPRVTRSDSRAVRSVPSARADRKSGV